MPGATHSPGPNLAGQPTAPLCLDSKTPYQVETCAANGKLIGERLSHFALGKVQTRQQFVYRDGKARNICPRTKLNG